MGIEIADPAGVDRKDWDSYVEQAPHATPFHLYDALDLFANYTDATLHLLVGFKGREPIGILPLFEIDRGPFTELHSPFSNSELMHLGPLRLNFEGMKKHRAEKVQRRFFESCWDWIKTAVDPDMVDIWCGPHHSDVRPYLWTDFEALPQYIYVKDVTPGHEELFNSLKKETRRRIRNTDDDAYEIIDGDARDTRTITRQVQDRYREQGVHYGLTPEFMAEFHDRFPDELIHTYCIHSDGEFMGGLVNVEFGDTMICWQGGASTDVHLPVNELLYWYTIKQAASMDLDGLDFTTAMVPNLADFKAKFGPDLKPVFQARWRSTAWQLAEFGYKHLPERGRNLLTPLRV